MLFRGDGVESEASVAGEAAVGGGYGGEGEAAQGFYGVDVELEVLV